MKNLAYVFLLASSLFLFEKAQAADATCSLVTVVRCMCAASMTIRCGNHEGNVKNDAPVKSVKVNVVSSSGAIRTVTLNNPPGGIRNFYGIEYNEWVRSQITTRPGDRLELAENPFVVAESTQLYEDHEATIPTVTAGGTAATPAPAPTPAPASGITCQWKDKLPTVYKFSSGCSKSVCSGMARCTLPNGVIADAVAGCTGNSDGSCPDATTCGASNEPVMSPAVGNGNAPVYDSATGTVTPR